MADTVRVRCPAKLNLTLDVGRPDADHGGRHPIASWMVALDFADDLTVTRSPVTSEASGFDLRFAHDAPAPQPIDWPPEVDLAFRAHAALERHMDHALPVSVILEKYIPAGAGLGGGSADAAGMLVALRSLFSLPIKDAALHVLATTLGADVSFALAALLGQPAALVTGFGEQLEALPMPATPLHVALVLPPFGCATGAVYRMYDELNRAQPTRPDAALRLATAERWPDAGDYFNDLAEPACYVQPALTDLLIHLRQADLPAHVTGSGSAVFIPAGDAHQAEHHARVAETVCGFPTVTARTRVDADL